MCVCVLNSYELVMPADGKWGDEYDGQWTGLLGLLQRKVSVILCVEFGCSLYSSLTILHRCSCMEGPHTEVVPIASFCSMSLKELQTIKD